MATKNDITNDSLITKAPTDAYRANYDAIFKKPKQEVVLQELTELSQDLGLYTTPQIPDICFDCEKCVQSEGHEPSCSSKAIFYAYILLRDTDKWKYFTESMLSTLEFKVWTEQQDRKYSNMFDKEEE